MTPARGPASVVRPARGRTAAVVLVAALVLAAAGFLALGGWQLYRLQWKLDLIARVEARVQAAPVPAPSPADWPRVSRAGDEYRHVRLSGRYLAGHDTRVQAATALGSGYWILTPFRRDDGAVVLVNRGFVPPGWAGDVPPAVGGITGLLRLPEPGGGFLRDNAPGRERWYSRDVAAIAAARGLGPVAPFFVDLDAAAAAAANAGAPGGSATLGGSTPSWPRAGLTVVRFRNNHLGYALTWFVLALMAAGAAVYVAHDARRRWARDTRPTDADGASPR